MGTKTFPFESHQLLSVQEDQGNCAVFLHMLLLVTMSPYSLSKQPACLQTPMTMAMFPTRPSDQLHSPAWGFLGWFLAQFMLPSKKTSPTLPCSQAVSLPSFSWSSVHSATHFIYFLIARTRKGKSGGELDFFSTGPVSFVDKRI